MGNEYQGPATLILTNEEWLIIWQHLSRIPLEETETIRQKIKRYLEARRRPDG